MSEESKALDKINFSIRLLCVTIFMISFIVNMRIRIIGDRIETEYNTTRVAIVQTLRETKNSILSERASIEESIKQLPDFEGKVVTMRREKGRYIISVEQEEKDTKTE